MTKRPGRNIIVQVSTIFMILIIEKQRQFTLNELDLLICRVDQSQRERVRKAYFRWLTKEDDKRTFEEIYQQLLERDSRKEKPILPKEFLGTIGYLTWYISFEEKAVIILDLIFQPKLKITLATTEESKILEKIDKLREKYQFKIKGGGKANRGKKYELIYDK